MREKSVKDEGVEGDDDGGEDDDEGEQQRYRDSFLLSVGVAQGIVAQREGLVERLDGVEGEEADGEYAAPGGLADRAWRVGGMLE